MEHGDDQLVETILIPAADECGVVVKTQEALAVCCELGRFGTGCSLVLLAVRDDRKTCHSQGTLVNQKSYNYPLGLQKIIVAVFRIKLWSTKMVVCLINFNKICRLGWFFKRTGFQLDSSCIYELELVEA